MNINPRDKFVCHFCKEKVESQYGGFRTIWVKKNEDGTDVYDRDFICTDCSSKHAEIPVSRKAIIIHRL